MAKKTSVRLGAGKFLGVASVAAGIMVALALLVVRQVLFGPQVSGAHEAADKASLQAFAKAAENQLGLLVKVTDGLSLSLAELPVRDLQASQEQWQARLATRLPAVKRFVVFPAGAVARDDHPDLPVSFAAVDMLRRVEAGEATHPEAFVGKDGRWYLQYASAIKQPSGPVQGVVLVIVDSTILNNVFPQGADGHFMLSQLVGGQSSTVKETGEGDRTRYALPLTIPGWEVSYQGIDRDAGGHEGLFWILLAVFSAVSALMGFLASAWLARQAQADISALAAFSNQLVTGGNEPKVRAGFELTRQTMTMLKKARSEAAPVRMAGKPAKKPIPNLVDEESAAAGLEKQKAAASEPLFQGDDALELFDEDDDLLGLNNGAESPEGMEIEEVEAIDMDAAIFRAYDIRGVVGQSLNADVVREIGRAIGSEALQVGNLRCCVGRDGRLSSPELTQALCEGLVSTGIDVLDIGVVPTPVLYFAVEQLQTGAGVMVTGSHNPAEHNGLKVLINGQALVDDQIQALYRRTQTRSYQKGKGHLQAQSMHQQYLDTIVADIAVAAPLKVVVDAGHGAASEIAPRLIEELGCDVVPINCEIDGRFPAHPPDPGKPENLQQLVDEVQNQGADLGIALDGDGDRIAVVTGSGKIIWPDRLLMLFAKDVVSRNPGADVLFDVKCSRNLNALVSRYGGRPIMWRSGHSVMKAKMAETGALLAGEMSGHIFFKERWFGFDDGIYSAARLLEILGIEEGGADAVFDEFPNDPATPELYASISDSEKFALIEQLQNIADWDGATLSMLDGLRAEYADGWGLCRASNTQNALTFRFEGESDAAIERIQAIFRERLLKIDPELVLPF